MVSELHALESGADEQPLRALSLLHEVLDT